MLGQTLQLQFYQRRGKQTFSVVLHVEGDKLRKKDGSKWERFISREPLRTTLPGRVSEVDEDVRHCREQPAEEVALDPHSPAALP